MIVPQFDSCNARAKTHRLFTSHGMLNVNVRYNEFVKQLGLEVTT
jgi:hypothetical protein